MLTTSHFLIPLMLFKIIILRISSATQNSHYLTVKIFVFFNTLDGEIKVYYLSKTITVLNGKLKS